MIVIPSPPDRLADRREQLRIHYHAAGRPHLDVDGQRFDVLDLSPHGALLRHASPERPAAGACLAGLLWFAIGEPVPVTGAVVRVAETEVAIRFDGTGVPLSRLMREEATRRDAREPA